jgi:hypothetical protein
VFPKRVILKRENGTMKVIQKVSLEKNMDEGTWRVDFLIEG